MDDKLFRELDTNLKEAVNDANRPTAATKK